jgi:hypothetical protein
MLMLWLCRHQGTCYSQLMQPIMAVMLAVGSCGFHEHLLPSICGEQHSALFANSFNAWALCWAFELLSWLCPSCFTCDFSRPANIVNADAVTTFVIFVPVRLEADTTIVYYKNWQVG